MRKWKMRLAMGCLAAAAATCMAAWTPFGGDKVTLGAVLQLTGPLAKSAQAYRDAYQFTVDKINEKGGITVGGKKYTLALRLLDSKSEPKLSTRYNERLISKDKVNFLLGGYSSSDALIAASVAEKQQVPLIQSGGASSKIFSQGYKYVYGTLPAAEDYFRSTIEMMRELKPEARTFGLVTGNDAFDLAVGEGTRSLLRNAGVVLVMHQEYSELSPNFYNILTLIQSKEPDVILWSGHETGVIGFIRAASTRNIHPKLFASFTVGITSANVRATLGKDANYAFGMTPWLPSDRLKDRWFGDAIQFAGAFETKFGYAPDYHAAAAAAAVEAYVQAVEGAGTLDRKLVRDAIARLDFESLYGRVRFGENGQIVLPQTVIQVQDGNLVEIFKDQFINRPIYPVPGWDKRS